MRDVTMSFVLAVSITKVGLVRAMPTTGNIIFVAATVVMAVEFRVTCNSVVIA